MNEYIAFRTAHGIDDNSYKDLYLGDYFTIQDGTYNVDWMVAHFDYFMNYHGAGDNWTLEGVVLIARTNVTSSIMNSTATTAGGYKASNAHTIVCPAIATALQTVLGNYLLDIPALVSKSINANSPSMAGSGITGCTNDVDSVTTKCILPNEVQICGTTIGSSSAYDVGEANHRLAVFNFISTNHVRGLHFTFWLRSIINSTQFITVDSFGFTSRADANKEYTIRPIIYIN